MCLGLVACRPYPWEIEQQRVFDTINEIEKNPDYALCNDFEYRSAEKAVFWEDLITEKLEADGKKVEMMDGGTKIFLKEPNTLKGAYVMFEYNYRCDFNWFGLNRKNNHYAIGTMFLDDYSFSIHYLKLQYDKFDLLQFSATQYCFYAEENLKGENDCCYLIMNRETGKIENKYSSFDEVEANFIGLTNTFNHSTYTENGTVYKVGRNTLQKETENDFINVPGIGYVLERSETLQEINAIIGITNNNDIYSCFATNGTELFVSFWSHTFWGHEPDLPTVVFRCDTSFDSFEYVGMVYQSYYSMEFRNTIIKLD